MIRTMFWNELIILVLLLLHAYFYAIVENPSSLAWFGGLAQGTALIFTSVYIGRVALRARKKEARFYLLLALGFSICFMAHLLLTYSELILEQPATGTITDMIWLIGYALIARSLVGLLGGVLSKTENIRSHVMMVAITGAIVFTALWIPIRDPDRTILVRSIRVIFPFLDLWIAFMALLFAVKTGRRVWLLAASGSLIIGITDLIFPYFHTMSSIVYRYLDVPLFIGYSLWWLLGVALRRKALSSFSQIRESA